MFRKSFIAFGLLLIACSIPLEAQERVMIGDDIFVSADEELDQAVCIGCSVYIEGRVDEVVAVGGSVTIAEEGRVGEAVAVGGAMSMDGETDGDVVALFGPAMIRGRVAGSVVSILGPLTLGEDAEIEDDAVVVMNRLNRADGAEIGGEVVSAGPAGGGAAGLAVSGVVLLLLVVVLVSLAILPLLAFVSFSILGAERVSTVAATVSQRAGMCFLIGLGTWIASIILSVLLPILFFWIPGGVGPAITVALFLSAAVGYTGVSYWVGRGMVKGGAGVGGTIVGAILITFVQAIPVIGWFIALPIFGWLALGAAVLSGFGTSTDWLLPRRAPDVIAKPAG